MKKRLVSLLLAAAMLVLLAVPAFAEDGHAYTYVALGDSITTGVFFDQRYRVNLPDGSARWIVAKGRAIVPRPGAGESLP